MIAAYGSPAIHKGVIDPIWDSVPKVAPKIVKANGSPPPTITTHGTFQLMWDDHAIYILADIHDEALNASSPYHYEQDSIEIFMDEHHDKSLSYEQDDVHFRVNFNNSRSADNGDLNRFYTQTHLTETGYVAQIRIALQGKPSNYQIVGFELQINIANALGKRVATINLFDATGNAYANPSLFGEVELVGKSDGDMTGLNPYDLLTYLMNAEEIDPSVYINGHTLNGPILAAKGLLEKTDVTQEQLDVALRDLDEAVKSLKRSETFDEPNVLVPFDGLHDPFTFLDGTRVTSEVQWQDRAAEIKDMYEFYMYGALPDTANEKVSYDKTADGLIITVEVDGKQASFHAEVKLPSEERSSSDGGSDSGKQGPYPVIVAIGPSRFYSSAFDVPLKQGYAVISFNHQDVASDHYGRTGAFFELYPYSQASNDVGALVAWSWGASKILDALELGAYEAINPKQSVITGFSRLGKAALVAGAFEPRFAVTNPHASGMGGAASFRYVYAGKHYPWGLAGSVEGLGNLQSGALGHWFNSVFGEFTDVKQLPFDQHLLMSLVAPRALIVTGGKEDYGTNPEGSFVSYYTASKVYEFLGYGDRTGFALREGSHFVSEQDYKFLVDFCDKIFRGIEPPETNFKDTPYEPDPAWDTIVVPE